MKASTYDGISTSQSIAVRLDFAPTDLPVHVDSLDIGLDIGEGNASSWALLYRLENIVNNAPSGSGSQFSQIVRVELSESGWCNSYPSILLLLKTAPV